MGEGMGKPKQQRAPYLTAKILRGLRALVDPAAPVDTEEIREAGTWIHAMLAWRGAKVAAKLLQESAVGTGPGSMTPSAPPASRPDPAPAVEAEAPEGPGYEIVDDGDLDPLGADVDPEEPLPGRDYADEIENSVFSDDPAAEV